MGKSNISSLSKSMDESNMPMDADMDHSQGVDECGMYGITPCNPSVDVSLERLGICPRQDAAHPSYATLDARLESYSTWPLHIKLRPQALSDAGFYYTGKGDRTICFQCGGGLKDWEGNDDPWKEHARYFSKCTYLLQKMGREFVDEVNGKITPEVGTSSSVERAESDTSAPSATPTPATSSFEGSLGPECTVSDVGSSSSGYSSSGSYLEESSSSQECKSTKTLDDQRACKICYAEEVGVVFLPCGHLVSCVNCAPSLKLCAVCRKPFSATVRAYLS